MPSSVRAAIAATAFLALSTSLFSPVLAQTPADFADMDAATRAPLERRTPKAAVMVAPEATTVGIAPAARAMPGARPYDSMIASHASSNGVPVELVHRVIVRESRYRASAMGGGGASGLMQIKLATARSMGYTGSAAGLLDPDTNLTYGVRYLAGAYRAAGGSHGRAVSYYASGYRGAARPARAYAMAPRQPAFFTTASAEAEPVALMERPVVHKHKRHHRHHHHRR